MRRLILASLMGITLDGYTQTVWEVRASCPGLDRWGPACFEIDGIGYMIGGRSGTTDLDEVWAYDPVTDTWEEKSSIPGVRRVSSGFSIGNKGYVTCGLYSSSSGRNDLWEYDPILDSWSERASLPSEAVYGATGFSLNGLGYLACGATGSGNGPYVSDLWEYDPAMNQWTARASLPDQGRVGASAFVADGGCFLFGGRQIDQTMSNELWRYDPIANSWTARASMPAQGRHYARSYSVYDKGLVVSGQNGVDTFDDCWYYDPGSNTWDNLPAYPGDGGWSGASFGIGDRVFAGLGQTNGFAYTDLWELTELKIGIMENRTADRTVVSPNPCPSGGDLLIEIPYAGTGSSQLTMFNAQGQLVHSTSLTSGQNLLTMPTLPSGFYYGVLIKDAAATDLFSISIID